MTRDYMGRDEFFAEARAALAEDDWRDDPSRDERWNAGVDFVMTRLCHFLSFDPNTVNWDAATETLDGDVQSVIGNILRKHFGEYWGPGVHPPLTEAHDKLTVEQAWTILCETPDITSPEEYPDHALITMEQLGSFMARPSPAIAQHPDDIAVDRFAAAMKAKLAAKRAEGYGGWDDANPQVTGILARFLVEHVPKGDPVDIANFAMMLHQRGADPAALRAAGTVDDAMVMRAIRSRYPVFDMWSETLQLEEKYKMKALLKAALGGV